MGAWNLKHQFDRILIVEATCDLKSFDRQLAYFAILASLLLSVFYISRLGHSLLFAR